MQSHTAIALACLAACTPGARPRVFGALRWTSDTAGPPFVPSVAVDSRGDVVIAGNLPYTANGQTIGIEKRSGADGKLAWMHALVPAAGSMALMPHLALEPDDSIVVTGAYGGTIDFGGQSLTGNGAFVARYAPDGTLVWASDTGPDAGGCGGAIATDPAGHIYVAGRCTGTLAVGGQMLHCSTSRDVAFVASFDADATGRWAVTAPGDGETRQGLAPTADGGVVMTESLRGAGTFGEDRIDGDGSPITIAARISADGVLEGARVVAPGSIDDTAARGTQIALATDGPPATIASMDPRGGAGWQAATSTYQDHLGAIAVLPSRTIVAGGDGALEAFSPDGDPLDAAGWGSGDSLPPGTTITALAPGPGGALAFAGQPNATDPAAFVGVLDAPE